MDNLPHFSFAGIAWPARIAEFHKSRYNVRKLSNGREVRATMRFAYYHAPTPITGRGDHGRGFYLASDGAPGLRWQWADDVHRAIRHKGWHTTPHGDGDTIRGVVFRLTHGRGFLAGYSMGEGMASSVEYSIYTEDVDAARAADEMARIAAEREMEACESEDCESEDCEG